MKRQDKMHHRMRKDIKADRIALVIFRKIKLTMLVFKPSKYKSTC